MAESSGRPKHEASAEQAQRRFQALQQERSRLHDRVLNTAESVRRSHEQTAETMENLADTGAAEDAPRRRRAAERSRTLAEEEARQVAGLADRDSRERRGDVEEHG